MFHSLVLQYFSYTQSTKNKSVLSSRNIYIYIYKINKCHFNIKKLSCISCLYMTPRFSFSYVFLILFRITHFSFSCISFYGLFFYDSRSLIVKKPQRNEIKNFQNLLISERHMTGRNHMKLVNHSLYLQYNVSIPIRYAGLIKRVCINLMLSVVKADLCRFQT